MDDEQDVKKMTVFINKQKTAYQSNFQLEFQDFVSFKQDYSDQEFDEELFDEENTLQELNPENFRLEKRQHQELIFTEEEQEIIESCTDPDLKRLLILNRSKNMQLIKLHKKMQDLLHQCEEEIEEKQSILEKSEAKHLNQQTFVWKLAAPYFKDKKFFPSPLNKDTIRKRARNELSVYDLVSSPKWSPIEFDRLTNAVKCNYNINRQNEIASKITTLKTKIQNDAGENKTAIHEMITLKEQLEQLKDDDKIPPLNSNEFLDWYKVAEIFLKDKHTAIECQSVWHMLIHPQINKLEWSDEENKSLESIAKAHSYQNWDDIAHELHTDRTGFTTCLHYFSKLCDKFKKTKFTPEEDRFLLDVVDIYKVGNFIPWNKVVCHFTNRSRHQLYHRYTYFLSQNHVKRGKFSEAEDILLIILVNKFGRNFKKCAEYMPNRSQVQLKSRYNSNLQRHITKGTYTAEEDQKIYEYAQKHGEKSWSGLVKVLTRCNAQVRQRYKSIKKFLRDNPNAKISDIPKRRHRFDDVNESQYDFLNYIADQYKDIDFIPTLSMIEETCEVEIGTPMLKAPPSQLKKTNWGEIRVKNVDTLLVEFFSSTIKTKQCSATSVKQCSVITEANLTEAADNASEVLGLLNVHLQVPENVECNAYLDNVDLDILERVSKGVERSKNDKLMPPNISNLVGLRSLIIKHREYKSQKERSSSFKSTLVADQSLETDKRENLCHQELFSKRFDALFDWSAILSLEKPKHFDVPEESNSTESSVPEPSSNAYGKRPLPQEKLVVKKRKISASALANLSHHPELKVVDRSVVENLVRKNNINLIKLDSVIGSNFTKKSVCRGSAATITEIPQVSSLSASDSENVNEDLHDVETLNVTLKTVKSEARDLSNSSEEYKAIKDDVQLLKEILKYEKVKVKPDPDGF